MIHVDCSFGSGLMSIGPKIRVPKLFIFTFLEFRLSDFLHIAQSVRRPRRFSWVKISCQLHFRFHNYYHFFRNKPKVHPSIHQSYFFFLASPTSCFLVVVQVFVILLAFTTIFDIYAFLHYLKIPSENNTSKCSYELKVKTNVCKLKVTY